MILTYCPSCNRKTYHVYDVYADTEYTGTWYVCGLCDRIIRNVGITDNDARVLCTDWHGGQTSGMYAFASTGTLDTDNAAMIFGEAVAELRHVGGASSPDTRELVAIAKWAEARMG